jgi:hypothetical protein
MKPELPLSSINIFIFYNNSDVAPIWLVGNEFKHCGVIVYDGNFYSIVEFNSYGIHLMSAFSESGFSVKWLDDLMKTNECISAYVICAVNKRIKNRWFPLWVKSCNEISREVTNVDIGFTFNPIHLYKKLLKYNGKRNYEILRAWRRNDGKQRTPTNGSGHPGGSTDQAERSRA